MSTCGGTQVTDEANKDDLATGTPDAKGSALQGITVDDPSGSGTLDLEAARRKDETRSYLARVVVIGYLTLLAVNVIGPLVLVSTGKVTVGDMKDTTLVISTALSGLIGVLGFVVGYYFKSEEDKERGKR